MSVITKVGNIFTNATRGNEDLSLVLNHPPQKLPAVLHHQPPVQHRGVTSVEVTTGDIYVGVHRVYLRSGGNITIIEVL